MIEHVFVIGIDGAGSYIKNTDCLNIRSIMAQGAHAFDAETSIPTISAQCWGSLLHGVPADAHKVTNEIACNEQYPEDSEYPSFMKVVRQQLGPAVVLGSYVCWGPINFGLIEKSAKCECFVKPDDQLVDYICDYISLKKPKVLFVQFDDVDHAGHTYGYGTDEYYKQINKTDAHIGKIIDKIKAEGIFEKSLIIITADHGGGGGDEKSHGSSYDCDKLIFWTCCGENIKKNFKIEEKMNILDTALVVTDALGIEAPKSFQGKLPKSMYI